MSFVVVFGAVLTFRIIAGRGGGASSAVLVVDAPPQTIVTDVRPNEQPTQLGTLTVSNAGTRPITFKRAFLSSVTPGLGLAGFAVLFPEENESVLGGQCGPFPPPNFATHPLDGAVLGPGRSVSIVVALRATREGEFSLNGLRVHFDVGAKHFHQDLPLRAEIRARDANPACRFDPTPHSKGAGSTA